MHEPTKLHYRTPTYEDGARLPDSPAAVMSLMLAPFAVVVDLVLYGFADASGKQNLLGAVAIMVVGLGLIGITLGLFGLFRRGHRKVAAAFAIPLHAGIATGFIFMLGSLA